VTDTRVPDAIDALVAALETVLGSAMVFDGPEITGDAPPVVVCVGYDGDPDGDMQAVANWEQTFQGMQAGTQRRAEAFDVLGCVVAFSGDVDVKTRRDAVFATFGQVAAVLRAQINVGLGLPQPTRVEFASGSLFQEQTTGGMQARIPFTVHVETRV
jgi:hypothetical protein